MARNLEQHSSSFVGTIHETGAAGVHEPSLSRFMARLCQGRLALPRTDKEPPISMTGLGSLADRGVVHRDINGDDARGAFDIEAYPGTGLAEFPALWSHAAEAERCLEVQPDTQGVVRFGMREQAVRTWERTASLLHSNLDFRFELSKPRHVCDVGGDSGRQGVAERAAPPGRLDVATVALGQLYFGLDDVLVAGHAPAAGPRQNDDLSVTRHDDVGCAAPQ